MDWKTIRLLGGIGSILAIAPYANFVGWVLVIVALYGISSQTGNKKIFNYYLVSVILGFASTLIFIFAIFGTTSIASAYEGGGEPNYAIIILVALLFIGILIVSAYFVKKSFIEVSKETKVDSFKTAGNLIFWGAVTMVVVVGFVIYFIGYIMQIISFFSLPHELLPEEPDPVFNKELSQP